MLVVYKCEKYGENSFIIILSRKMFGIDGTFCPKYPVLLPPNFKYKLLIYTAFTIIMQMYISAISPPQIKIHSQN